MKRRFSPVILSAILVFVMLVLAAIIIFMPKDQFYEDSQTFTTFEEACSESNLVLDFSVPCDNEENLGFGITNVGNTNVEKLEFEVVENDLSFSNTLGAQLLRDNAHTFFLDVNQIDNVKTIVVKPSVLVNDEIGECPPINYEVSTIYEKCEFNSGTDIPSDPNQEDIYSGGGGGGGSSSSGDDGTTNPPVIPCPNGYDHDGDGYGVGCELGEDCEDFEYQFDSCHYLLEPYGGWEAADFALVKDPLGSIHTIYIRGVYWLSNSTHGTTFGHEDSSDMINWNWNGLALSATESGTWDTDNVWAPDIEYHNNMYYMFYTGVNDVSPVASNHKERLGLATSSDLNTWTRYPINNCFNTTGDGCLFECDWGWNSWGEKENDWAYQCRDPDVFYDSSTGNWYMVIATAFYNEYDIRRMVVGLAKSTDLISWQDLGPINVTIGAKAESPVIWEENGYYYLFWTTKDDGELTYSYTDSLEGEWSNATILYGSNVSQRAMIANEFISFNGENLMGYVHAYIPSYRNLHFEKFEVVQDIEPHKVVLKPVEELGCDFVPPENINPGALDICENGIDEDCSGADAICPPTCTDDDNDGYYLESSGCGGEAGFLGHNDCNDTNSSLFYLQNFYLDEDHDLFGSDFLMDTRCWGVGGYYDLPIDEMSFNNLDCDDLNANIWQEVNLYVDNDGDGYGWINDTNGSLVCVGDSIPVGYSEVSGDCRDIEADCADVLGMPYLYCAFNLNLINPGMDENCTNEIDDDCDGQIDCNCGDGICDVDETCAGCIEDCEGEQADCAFREVCLAWDHAGAINTPTCHVGCGNDYMIGGCFDERLDSCTLIDYSWVDPSTIGSWGGCEQGLEICCGMQIAITSECGDNICGGSETCGSCPADCCSLDLPLSPQNNIVSLIFTSFVRSVTGFIFPFSLF